MVKATVLGKTLLLLLLLLLLLMLLAANTHADTGNDVLRDCSKLFAKNAQDFESILRRTDCGGYVRGMMDMARLMHDMAGLSAFCIPKVEGLETGQVIRVFIKWLEEHPESLHESARSLFVEALVDTYPCTQQPNNGQR